MPTFLDLLDTIASLIGGPTQDPNNPHYFSGGGLLDPVTGLPALKGCWSIPPDALQETPVAVLFGDDFTISGPEHQETRLPGVELNTDNIRLIIYLAAPDWRTKMPFAAVLRDTIPTLLAANTQLKASTAVYASFITSGRFGTLTYAKAKVDYVGWEFNFRVLRMLPRVYQA